MQAIFVTSYYLAVGELGRLSVPVLKGYWFVISGVITVSMLPSIWPTCLAYLLAALGGLLLPELHFEFAAWGNLVLCVNAFVVYRHQRKDVLAREARAA